MFNTVSYPAGLGSLVPIKQLYPPLFTSNAKSPSVLSKVMRGQHLESCLYAAVILLKRFPHTTTPPPPPATGKWCTLMGVESNGGSC